MKNKYIESPAELLMFDIVKILYKHKTIDKCAPYLIKKIGMNEKQINFLFDSEYEEELSDADDLRNKLLSFEDDYIDNKLSRDLRFIKRMMINNIVMFIISFIGIGLIIYYMFIEPKSNSEESFSLIKILIPTIFLVVFSFLTIIDLKFTVLNFKIKRDLKNKIVKVKTLINIKDVKPLIAQSHQNRNAAGLIIINEEENKLIKYYLITTNMFISNRIKKDALIGRNLNITYYERSKYILNEDYKKIVNLVDRIN